MKLGVSSLLLEVVAEQTLSTFPTHFLWYAKPHTVSERKKDNEESPLGVFSNRVRTQPTFFYPNRVACPGGTSGFIQEFWMEGHACGCVCVKKKCAMNYGGGTSEGDLSPSAV